MLSSFLQVHMERCYISSLISPEYDRPYKLGSMSEHYVFALEIELSQNSIEIANISEISLIQYLDHVSTQSPSLISQSVRH